MIDDNTGAPSDNDDGASGAPAHDTTAAPTPAPAPAQRTLDQVYKDHKIEDDAARHKPSEYRPLPPVQKEDGQEIIKVLNDVTQEVNSLRNERHVTAVRADIDSACALIEKETGLDAEVIESFMDSRARKDPRFQQVWDNRRANPRAYNDALQALTHEIADKFQGRGDPDLLANQKAMRAYQSGSATRRTSDNNSWDNLSPQDFARKWEQMRNGY